MKSEVLEVCNLDKMIYKSYLYYSISYNVCPYIRFIHTIHTWGYIVKI